MKDFIKKIGIDKVHHFIAGMLISEHIALLLNNYTSNFRACLVAMVLTGVIGVLKEVFWDGILGKGHVENNDSHATTIGAFVGSLIILTIG